MLLSVPVHRDLPEIPLSTADILPMPKFVLLVDKIQIARLLVITSQYVAVNQISLETLWLVVPENVNRILIVAIPKNVTLSTDV